MVFPSNPRLHIPARQTAVGRATVIALKLNNEYLTRTRRRWVLAGWHLPVD